MSTFYKMEISRRSFNFFLRRSLYIHGAILIVTLLGGKYAWDLNLKEREKNLQLIQASVRVDMVAMPNQTLNELKNLSSEAAGSENKQEEETKEEIKEEVVKEKMPDPSAVFEEAQKKKRQDFLNKLKKIANKKIEADGEKKTTTLKSLVLSGNKLNRGTQIYGESNSEELNAFQSYISRLPDLVRPYWKLPSFLMDKNLKCRIRIWLTSSGEISRAVVYQSSGESDYDQRAIEAVKAAAPFPELKEEFSRKAINGDILLGFPL